MPPYGACLLGSINLARAGERAVHGRGRARHARGSRSARGDRRALSRQRHRRLALSAAPQQAKEAQAKRRIGLGVTGLADALILCGVALWRPRRRALAAGAGWQPSRTRPTAPAPNSPPKRALFPLFDGERFLAAPTSQRLDGRMSATAIAAHGIRNGCLTSIAPTGTISLLAGNVSSGIEPVFDFATRRRVLRATADMREEIGRGLCLRAATAQRFGQARSARKPS